MTTSNTERKLASIRRISLISPIENADNIELISVDGWNVVSQKGQHKVGDLCVYFEIDSFLPVEDRYEFLRPSCYKKFSTGEEGFRIKTMKLRKKISQGLILPTRDFGFPEDMIFEGNDVTEFLGVKHYDPPIPAEMNGMIKGHFPSEIPKTNQERIQNIFPELCKNNKMGDTYQVTLKLDGTSCTVLIYSDGTFGVCQRNFELITEGNDNNAYVKAAKDYAEKAGIKPEHFGEPEISYAVQGELMGPGIQGNRENLKEVEFYVFDIFSVTLSKFMKPEWVREWCENRNIKHVPVLETHASLPESIEDALEMADTTKSINHPVAEGLVFKLNDDSTRRSFKVISNRFLLKQK